MTDLITIPTVGSCLTLTEKWVFNLWAEYTNEKFWIALFGEPKNDPQFFDLFNVSIRDPDWRCPTSAPSPTLSYSEYRFWHTGKFSKEVVLPAKTVLKIAKIVIRKFHYTWDYNFITFQIIKCPDSNFKGRFWAKLKDINQIKAKWDDSTIDR